MSVRTPEGFVRKSTWQVADVRRLLVSASHIIQARSDLFIRGIHYEQEVPLGQSSTKPWKLTQSIKLQTERGPRKQVTVVTAANQKGRVSVEDICQKRGISKNLPHAVRTVMHQRQVDLVAGDFHGAAWRLQSGSDSRFISSVEETFVNTNLPLPPGSTPLWEPGGIPGEWSDVCGFFKPPGSEAAIMEPSPSPTTRWVSRKKIKVAIIKFGSTSSTSMLDSSIAYPVMTNNVGQSQGRGTHRMTTARKEDSTSNTRQFASVIRVTHVTTRGCH